MSGEFSPGSEDELKQLLLENQRLLKEIHAATEKTRRYILWDQVWGFVKLLIIIVPLALGYLYIQPYLKQALASLQEIYGLGSAPAASTGTKQINVPQNIWDQLQKSGITLPPQK